MSLSHQRILIIGGGFSGMAAAIELRKQGAQVDLVEIDPGWRSYGAGISLGGATLRAFRTLGVLDAFLAHGHAADGVQLCLPHGPKVADLPTRFVTKGGATISMLVSAARFAMDRRDYMVINARDAMGAQGPRNDHKRTGILLGRGRIHGNQAAAFQRQAEVAPDAPLGLRPEPPPRIQEAPPAARAQIKQELAAGYHTEQPMSDGQRSATGSPLACRRETIAKAAEQRRIARFSCDRAGGAAGAA